MHKETMLLHEPLCAKGGRNLDAGHVTQLLQEAGALKWSCRSFFVSMHKRSVPSSKLLRRKREGQERKPPAAGSLLYGKHAC